MKGETKGAQDCEEGIVFEEGVLLEDFTMLLSLLKRLFWWWKVLSSCNQLMVTL